MSLRQVLGLVDGNKARTVPMSDNAEQHPLWTLLNSSSLPGSGSGMPPLKNLASLTLPALGSKDSTATSLRVLLCDAQDALRTFTQQVHTLVNDVGRAASQMDESVKVSEDQRAAATEDLKTLIIRVQNTITRSLEQTNATLGDLKTGFVRQDSKVESLQQQIVTLTQQLGLSLQHQTESTRLLERAIKEQEKRTRLSLELYQRQERNMLAQNNTNRQLLSVLVSMNRTASSDPAATSTAQAQNHVPPPEPALPAHIPEVTDVEPLRALREIQTPPPTSPLALPVALVKSEPHSAPSGHDNAPIRPPALSPTAIVSHTGPRKTRKISINTTIASSSPLSSPPVSRRGSIGRGQKRSYDDAMFSDSLFGVGVNQNQFDQSVSAEMVVHGMGWLAPGSSGSNPNPNAAQQESGMGAGPTRLRSDAGKDCAENVRSGDVAAVVPKPPKIPRRPVRRIIDQQATFVD